MSEGDPQQKTVLVKCLISVFIVCQVLCTVVWLIPSTLPTGFIKRAIRVPWVFCGFRQRWDMFMLRSPNLNTHAIGLIAFEDGTITSWTVPRVDLMDQEHKFTKFKVGKWDIHSFLPKSRYKEGWPTFARYVCRLSGGASNKPVWFMIVRMQAEVPPATSFVARDQLPERSQLCPVFFYRYKPGDFQ